MFQISSPLTRDSCGDKTADNTTLSVRAISLVKDVARNTYISTVDVAVQPGLRNNTDIHAARRQLFRKFIELFLDRPAFNQVETRKLAGFLGLTSGLGVLRKPPKINTNTSLCHKYILYLVSGLSGVMYV